MVSINSVVMTLPPFGDLATVCGWIGSSERIRIGHQSHKLRHSSDGFGPVELHRRRAVLWGKGIHCMRRLSVADAYWSESDTIQVIGLIARDNAARVNRIWRWSAHR
jgi:hypothetical protein